MKKCLGRRISSQRIWIHGLFAALLLQPGLAKPAVPRVDPIKIRRGSMDFSQETPPPFRAGSHQFSKLPVGISVIPEEPGALFVQFFDKTNFVPAFFSLRLEKTGESDRGSEIFRVTHAWEANSENKWVPVTADTSLEVQLDLNSIRIGDADFKLAPHELPPFGFLFE